MPEPTTQARNTVTVMCRWPSGIVLSLYSVQDAQERDAASKDKRPNMTPMQAVKRVTLNGMNRDPSFHPKENILLGKAGRTEVDAEFWKSWKEQHADSDLVKNNLVFAETTAARAEARLEDFEKEPMGREGLDPDNLSGSISREEDR